MTMTRSEHAMVAADVMSSPVISVDAASSIWQAGDLMLNQQVRHVLVVSGGRCVGVIRDRDILEAWYEGPAAMRATPVRRRVSERTSCVLPDAALSQVAQVMNVNRVDAVPVVDPAGKALGIVTAGDVVAAVARYGVTAHDEDAS